MIASDLAAPVFFLCVLILAAVRRAPVYESFVRGAAEGLKTALRVAPYLIAVMAMTSVMNASGLMDLLTRWTARPIGLMGLPPGTAPFVLVRPFSGAGALGAIRDLFDRYGADSAAGRAASVLMASAETVFYSIAVYFGSAGVRKSRYTVPAALFSMLAGWIAAGWICRIWPWQ